MTGVDMTVTFAIFVILNQTAINQMEVINNFLAWLPL